MELQDGDSRFAASGMPLVAAVSFDPTGLAELIGAFLAMMRRRSSPSEEDCEVAFERLERLQKRLSAAKEGEMITLPMNDNLVLDAALMLFSVFLYLEVPQSVQRETAINALWGLREGLADMRRNQPALN